MATVTSQKPALAIAPPLERPSSAQRALQFCTASYFAAGPRPARRLALLHLCMHARRAPVRGTGGARTAAAQHELHCERRPAPAAVHRQIPHALPVGRTLCPRKALSRATTYVYRQTLGGPRAARAREIRGTRERGGRGPRGRGPRAHATRLSLRRQRQTHTRKP